METYAFLREAADSWGLLALTLIFLGVAVRAFRPGAKAIYDEAASIPLRDDDDAACVGGCPDCAKCRAADFGEPK